MSEIMQWLGVVVGEALDDAPWFASYNQTEEPGNTILRVCNDHTKETIKFHGNADQECDRLNNEYVALKVIEALKDAPLMGSVYNNYNCDTIWREQTSASVWDNWIQAILK